MGRARPQELVPASLEVFTARLGAAGFQRALPAPTASSASLAAGRGGFLPPYFCGVWVSSALAVEAGAESRPFDGPLAASGMYRERLAATVRRGRPLALAWCCAIEAAKWQRASARIPPLTEPPHFSGVGVAER